MASAAQFRTEHLAAAPRGFKVRTIKRGSHEIRIGFPPGRRKKGSGKVLEILHPKAENASLVCQVTKKAKSNPMELLVFGNPSRRRARPNANHKPGCKCFACKHQRKIGRANPRRRRHDRNPSETEQAVSLFESFHGKNANQITEKHVSAVIRKDYTALGDLVSLKIKTPIGGHAVFNFEGDGVKLASSPNGKQLYCIGGNQNLAPMLDAASREKDLIDLGECTEVAYLARKIHSNYEPVEWFHKFGENTGVKPQLMFNKLQKQIFFIGGEYFIDPKVDVSPGIEN
jgi:hypothetical protein